jgi:3-methyladenine DNA glycosylase/8-oxoguanine DNA glycosylase
MSQVFSPEAGQRLAELDPVLGQLIARVGPITLRPRRLAPYQSLVQAIIYQQLSGKAAATILRRFCALFGPGKFPKPAQVLAATPERLRSAGLSRGKASYVQDVAAKAAAGELPTLAQCDGLADGEIIARLTAIKGVGRWTAEMFLIFNLGRVDVLPVHDLGVRKGFQVTYRKRALPSPEQLDRFGARWQPHRTTAAWYLWRSLDTPAA